MVPLIEILPDCCLGQNLKPPNRIIIFFMKMFPVLLSIKFYCILCFVVAVALLLLACSEFSSQALGTAYCSCIKSSQDTTTGWHLPYQKILGEHNL